MSEVTLRLNVAPKNQGLSRDDWNSIRGTPAWFRMRRNAVKITFEKLNDQWAAPGKLAEAVGEHLKKWLGQHAKDAFFIDQLSSSVEIFLYDARDGVDLKMKWHTVEQLYRIRDY